jgi:type IV pilus assembly protein PilA
MIRTRKNEQGFTLIELMIVVAILGILAAVAIPAFLEYMRKGKNSEAQVQLNSIGKKTKTYFVETGSYPGYGGGPTNPAAVACSKQSSAAWDNGDAVIDDAWEAIEFAIPASEQLLFVYTFNSNSAIDVTATAEGDLNCDGNILTWTMTGDVSGGVPGIAIAQTAKD